MNVTFCSHRKLVAMICIVAGSLPLALVRSGEGEPTPLPLVFGAESSKVQVADRQVEPIACHRGVSQSTCCCEPVCCPQRVVEKEEKTCWKVSSKFVCIPGFRFPWECCNSCGAGSNCCENCGGCCSCGTPLCGTVRCVNILEQHKYECEKCGYLWEVKCVRTNRDCQRCPANCPHCGQSNQCVSSESDNPEVQQLETSEVVSFPPVASQDESFAAKFLARLKE